VTGILVLPRPVGVTEGVMPTDPFSLTTLRLIPQPIWYPTSRVPPASPLVPDPFTLPVNVAATRYSRDDRAVVSGATATWYSSRAATVSSHPSGVRTVPAGPDGTAPAGGGTAPVGGGTSATGGGTS